MSEDVSVGAAADELMAAFAAVHELFTERFRGVKASVPITHERFVAFGFGDLRDTFAVYEATQPLERAPPQPLNEAPLALRAQLAQYIPELWAECEKRFGFRVDNIRHATATLRTFIDSKEGPESE